MDLVERVSDFPFLTAIFQIFGAALASVTAAITLEAPRNLLSKVGFIGGLGYAFYLFFAQYYSDTLATFLACLIVSLTSHWAARKFKSPVTIFYIPAFFPFVPGSAIYQTAFYFINGDSATSAHFFVKTLQTAGAIALGVFIADSTLEIYWTIRGKWQARKN